MTRPLVLDSGALVAVERGQRHMAPILADARAGRATLIVPVAVLAEVWFGGGPRQAQLARLLSDSSTTVRPLTVAEALAAGALLHSTPRRAGKGEPRPGAIDAYVAACARAVDAAAIITSDPDDLAAFKLAIPIIVV